jgi:hypothetical protein
VPPLRGGRRAAGGGLVIAIVAALTLVFAASAYAGSCECVRSVEPNSGPKAGGSTVTIKVQAFGEVTALKFGSKPATISKVESEGVNQTITAISPPGEGTVDVIATLAEGPQSTTPGCRTGPGESCDRFTYLPTGPVTQVEPDFGPTHGGTAVRISGISLSGATAVMFGSTPAASFTVQSDSSIIARSPSGTGTVDITVTTPGGTSATGVADLFSYATPGDGTIFPTPSLGSEGNLNGTSCLSLRFCVAVGHAGIQGAEGLIEQWNGHAWAVAAAPPTEKSALGGAFPVTITAQFNGVSCTSPTFCAAVGTERASDPFSPDSSGPRVLLANWNGATWSFPAVTNKFPGEATHGGFGRPALNGVSCVSPRFCVAVGTHGNSGIPGPRSLLVESWNGETWSPVSSPAAIPGLELELQGVSCTSTAFCVVVGAGGLIESWNGTAWSVLPNPSSGTLNGVWCASAKRCLAVGAEGGASLIESWDGSSWSILESPKPVASALNSVTCVSNRRCVAVGSYTAGGAARTLVESLEGGRWSVDGVSDSTALNGVSCTATGSCFAVGYDEASSAGPSQPLVLVGSI